MECVECGVEKEKLLRAKNEKGKIVDICESCYEGLCEGYELIE